jgi:hypothetical protein
LTNHNRSFEAMAKVHRGASTFDVREEATPTQQQSSVITIIEEDDDPASDPS